MNILFYRPYDCFASEENGTSHAFFDPKLPYSLSVVAKILQQEKKDVSVLDAMAEKLSLKKTLQRIEKIRPDILVINVSVIGIDIDFKGIQEVKDALKCKVVALVNNDYIAQIFQRYPLIDVIIHREWGWALLDVVNCYEGNGDLTKVPGIYVNQDGEIIKTEKRAHRDIDDLPLPALELFPMKRYSFYQSLWSEGCLYHCVFCYFSRYPKSGWWKGRNIDSIIDEIKYFQSFGNRPISCMDNDISIDVEYAKNLCQRIIDERLKIFFSNNVRASVVDDELFRLLSEAGCTAVGFGVESGNQEVLNRNLKHLNLDDVFKTYDLLKKYNIAAEVFFLIGLMGDTRETIEETFEFITEKLKASKASFDIAIPHPQTPFYKYLKNNGWIDDMTIDNLIWIYKNVYAYHHLNEFPGEKPNWRISDELHFDELYEIMMTHYHLVPKGNTRDTLKYIVKRGPSAIYRAGLELAAKPHKILKIARKVALNR